MAEPAAAITVDGLTKKFADLTAVEGLAFEVNEGEIFWFLGPNGAGKTTTVRMLCCLISKTSGKAKIGGYEIGNEENALRIRKIIGLVPDNVGLYESLTAYENLEFYSRLYDIPKRKERIYQVAYVLLILFAVVVIYNDLTKAIPGLSRLP